MVHLPLPTRPRGILNPGTTSYLLHLSFYVRNIPIICSEEDRHKTSTRDSAAELSPDNPAACQGRVTPDRDAPPRRCQSKQSQDRSRTPVKLSYGPEVSITYIGSASRCRYSDPCDLDSERAHADRRCSSGLFGPTPAAPRVPPESDRG